MQNKSKNKGNKAYVETRNRKRRQIKRALRAQLAINEGEFEKIAALAGVPIHSVYKSLNENQPLFMPRVIDAAKEYIRSRNESEGIPQPEIVTRCM
ncbi:hypothetical protein EGT74_24310 [Chitinophaga lutea]|uniref:XRE family transcriptional regulator n=1 Tax=Chitinophaga lutea TaxID=2488634 RepID=A0A3N4PKZ0_9BACT|nr:hypothetical protein [Chitinophaga lutea]RPE05511.1 hypothetical protein EGT74_24310 [Chitinophaga lutea]